MFTHRIRVLVRLMLSGERKPLLCRVAGRGQAVASALSSRAFALAASRRFHVPKQQTRSEFRREEIYAAMSFIAAAEKGGHARWDIG